MQQLAITPELRELVLKLSTQLEDTPDVNLLTLWQKYAAVRKHQVSPSTYKNTYLVIESHLTRCPHKTTSKACEIFDWANENLTADATRRFLMQCSAVCKWAIRRQLMSHNPFEGMAQEIKVPKRDKPDPFSREERIIICEAFERERPEVAPLIKFLFWTGARTGEALALQWKHVSPDFLEIEFREVIVQAQGGWQRKKGTKNGTTRRFPCNAQLQALLREIKPEVVTPTTPVFKVSRQLLRTVWQGRVDPVQQGIVARLAEEGKIKRYRCQYSTRHTFCTEMLERGISPAQIAEWVGNSTEMIVRHYVGYRPVAVPDL